MADKSPWICHCCLCLNHYGRGKCRHCAAERSGRKSTPQSKATRRPSKTRCQDCERPQRFCECLPLETFSGESWLNNDPPYIAKAPKRD